MCPRDYQNDAISRPGAGTALLASVIDAPGASPRIEEVVLPRRSAGQTLISVVAAPLNPLDLLIASGNFHSARHDSPYIPGSECVGIVQESDCLPVGTWVYAETRASPQTPGTFAMQALIADENLLELPAGIDPVMASAVGNSGIAAYMPLVERAGLQAGETVMVLGATGAVGQLAIQIARGRGAGKVIAVARNKQALQALLALGADVTVQILPGEGANELAARMRESAGPVDVVLDGLYGAPLEAAVQVCAPGARIVNIGNMAGSMAQLPAGLLRGKQITLSGFAGLHCSLQEKRAALHWLWAALEQGGLQLEVRQYQLSQLPEAWEAQQGSPHAKCVLLPGKPGAAERHASKTTNATAGDWNSNEQS